MTLEARLETLGLTQRPAYRALCGREPRGLLGHALQDEDGAWYLSHPRGYYWDSQRQIYRTLTGKPPSHRLSFSKRLELSYQGGQNASRAPKWALIGETPRPPCEIECPTCKQVNRVMPPNAR